MVFLSLFLSLVLSRVPYLSNKEDPQTKRILALSGTSSAPTSQQRSPPASLTQTRIPLEGLVQQSRRESLPRSSPSPSELPSHRILGRLLSLSSLQPRSDFQLLRIAASECRRMVQVTIPKQKYLPAHKSASLLYCLISVKSITVLSKCQHNPEFPSHSSV